MELLPIWGGTTGDEEKYSSGQKGEDSVQKKSP
jgi:hypothetical protein